MNSTERSDAFENRLIEFAVRILSVAEALPVSYAAQHFSKQIIRSGSAPALLYGEARGAESPSDFCHKASIALKELRETFITLKLIARMGYLPPEKLALVLDENNQLISIFVVTVRTSKEKRIKKK